MSAGWGGGGGDPATPAECVRRKVTGGSNFGKRGPDRVQGQGPPEAPLPAPPWFGLRTKTLGRRQVKFASVSTKHPEEGSSARSRDARRGLPGSACAGPRFPRHAQGAPGRPPLGHLGAVRSDVPGPREEDLLLHSHENTQAQRERPVHGAKSLWPWLVGPSGGWGIVLQTWRSRARFPVRAQAWDAGQVPPIQGV